jgi:hypothetical protein
MKTKVAKVVIVDRSPRQIHCICHGGGKVLHYFQRAGLYGDIYVCSACGAEKTVTA